MTSTILSSELRPPASGDLLTRRKRIFGTARGLILQWRDRSHLLFDIYTFGAPPLYCVPTSTREANFIRMMRTFEAAYAKQQILERSAQAAGDTAQLDVPAMNAGFTDRDYGEVFEAVCEYVRVVAQKGRWRRRRM